MNSIELRLENVRLHNKVQMMRNMEKEKMQSIRKNKNIIKLYIEEKIKKLNDENEKLRKEKEKIEKNYYAIPKWIRNIFRKD